MVKRKNIITKTKLEELKLSHLVFKRLQQDIKENIDCDIANRSYDKGTATLEYVLSQIKFFKKELRKK